MHCPHCGFENKETAKFCENCGKPIQNSTKNSTLTYNIFNKDTEIGDEINSESGSSALEEENEKSAIIECKICKKEVARTAATCPNCGISYPGLDIKCPKCKSSNFSVGKKGFGLGKMAGWGVLLGPIGLAGGFIGRGQVELHCLNCNKKWKPKKSEFK